jgi:hypothetical protein
MSNNNTEMFAFGENTFRDCECPAMSVGVDPLMNDVAMEAVVAYDNHMEDVEGKPVGVTDEQKARNAWLASMDHLSGGALREAKYIAEELNWLNDD